MKSIALWDTDDKTGQCGNLEREDGTMHMTPSYSTHSEVINICPIALTEGGRKVERKEGDRWRWNQTQRQRKISSGIVFLRHLSYFPALLQTEPLNSLTEQQQRLFKTQRCLGAGSVFSAWPKG